MPTDASTYKNITKPSQKKGPSYLQAALEDNPPVYILGGNIVPLGSSGMMTTSHLRASNLTLIAAFPSTKSPPFERCGEGCAEQSSASRLVTCGHMYLDQGRPLAPVLAQHSSGWLATW